MRIKTLLSKLVKTPLDPMTERALWRKLQVLADDWHTCAVGENIEALRRRGLEFHAESVSGTGGRPLSPQLEVIGIEFLKAVNSKELKQAASHYEAIKNFPASDEKELTS